MVGSLKYLVSKKGGIILMGGQELFHLPGGLLRPMARKQGRAPVLREEDVPGPLDIFQFVQPWTDVAYGVASVDGMIEIP